LRIFVIAFTTRSKNQINKNAKAGHAMQKLIRAKMVQTVQNRCAGKNLKELLESFKSEQLDNDVFEEVKSLRPISSVNIRKVKMIRRPKIDAKQLNSLYNEKEGGKKSKAHANKEDEGAKNLLERKSNGGSHHGQSGRSGAGGGGPQQLQFQSSARSRATRWHACLPGAGRA